MMLDGVTFYVVRPLILLRLPTPLERGSEQYPSGAGRASISSLSRLIARGTIPHAAGSQASSPSSRRVW